MKGPFTLSNVVPTSPTTEDKMEAELEEALDVAGVGKYQFLHCGLMVLILSSALLEIIGVAFVMPAALCDLHIPDRLKGFITALPNIGIILTATLWGWMADTYGRKPVLIVSTASAGLLGATAAFMPNLASYALLKFAASLFLTSPSSLAFAYGGELVPRRRRDLAVILLSALLMLMSTLSPALAWITLPSTWSFPLGSISFRPWRLLTILNAAPLLLSSCLLTLTKESPKFLITKGKHEEALSVLKYIYSTNSGLPENVFPASLEHLSEEDPKRKTEVRLMGREKKDSVLDLLRPPHLKWLSITGFLMFGVFSLLNGLFLFSPDTINKVMSETNREGTICDLMWSSSNTTNNGTCIDTISTDTLSIMVVTTFVYSLVVLAASLTPVSKKTLLVGTYLVVGVACLSAGLLRQRMVAGAAMSALQLTALGIGPLTAYAVYLFPTTLRGTAVGALLMFGRAGSAVGAAAAGAALSAACDATFYGFTILLLVCAALSFVLPSSERTSSDEYTSTTTVTEAS